ncbi:Peroxidase 2 [Carex littledalei]|uniref:Peroxidase n=1 Tax=Carex littledalei TaxID=544730 RepID=A0A833V902_9POAL|nr:Peroxidase 2 [Carex littledalei]
MSTARNTFLLLSCFFLIVAVSTAFTDFNFYPKFKNCHDAENIVRDVVEGYVKKDPGLGAGLIRMFFHDCFVRGCDASILLDKYDNTDTEKFAIPNNPSLRGFEVIDAAKEKLEKEYPGVVSCADIIAFAARDAAYFLSKGKISYNIPSGRLDGRISIKDEVLPALPAPFHNLTEQKVLYEAKGISTAEMVALLGAHSIGRSHCSSFTSRLYPTIDPTMDPGFASNLKNKCPDPKNKPVDGVVVQDFLTPDKLDNEYYDNVKALKSLFFSDWSLLTSDETRELVTEFSEKPEFFAEKFAEAMIKLGNIEVKTGTQGEIRKSCRVVNYPTTTAPPPPANVPTTRAPPPPANVPTTMAPPPPYPTY